MLGDIEIKEPSTYDSCRMEEKAPNDPESSTEFAPTKVCVTHILFQRAAMPPTKLQEHSKFDDSHDKILSSNHLDTGQAIDKKSFGC
ncbi:hypothetical protein D8674_003169 [Pyrus ussuriensis x Pyrus communis]|uniref:Uncharacterized protein n=1 Tax=Pyrus ussuriensis x Pyrus communis TaxID=2448454 RepID=A0A5N5FV73_9ROSA|nr:hypothetical protein D8674_003169 [Pyrus ussuriensis x Pyrus communis]